jgi:hypothetical protein
MPELPINDGETEEEYNKRVAMAEENTEKANEEMKEE